ncbi:MAG: hypothetical protein AAF998_05720 [Bacteroidota bacterium]
MLDQIRKKTRRVALLGIKFRWEGRDHTNASTAILPEIAGWTPSRRSVAAYCIKDTRETIEKGKLQVAAHFRKRTPGGRIQVRTRDIPVHIKDVFTGQIVERKRGLKALGSARPTTVFFSDSSHSVYRGKHAYVPLTLEDVRFPELGVGIYDVNWHWEYRLLDEEKSTKREDVWEKRWRNLTITQHRIYVLLEAPKFPWMPSLLPNFLQAAPFPGPPGQHALNVACEWARGAKTRSEIARRITQGINRSGRFVYDVNPHYYEWATLDEISLIGDQSEAMLSQKLPVFHFGKVMERLDGGHGLGEKANCIDCALMVMTLANILGCDLQVSKLQASDNTDTADPNFYTDNRFAVNRIRAIGHPDSETTLQGLQNDGKHYFSFHAVAWDLPEELGQISEDTMDVSTEEISGQLRIYDACVEFVEETEDGETYTSAADLPFAEADAQPGYRNLLAAALPEGRDRCRFQTATVIRPQIN